MRNKKRETDISQYKERTAVEHPITNRKPDSGVKYFFKGLLKMLFTAISVCFVAFVIAGISLAVYIFSLASEPTGIDLKAKSLNQTSYIMVMDNETGEYYQYQQLYSTENRIWVNNSDIPQAMKDAIVAIEDKRYYNHSGVDWTRTASAVVNLFTGNDSYGGSTITQQLIKNITDDNEVSITRKLREICKAMKLENEYTKDQILEAYLNVVNFGNNCQGVEAAAQLYFDKSITDCSVAECAAIAGITQNPSLWNPLVYPENNQERREVVIQAMYDQKKITKEEYQQAMDESAEMTFVGFQNVSDDDDDDDDDDYVQNWYIDELYYDLKSDLAEYYGISEDAASDKIYTEGLRIYCAMDLDMQNYMEEAAQNIDDSYDDGLQIGSTLMGFDGRVIATVGSSKKKDVALQWDRANDSTLQPGSSIKPVAVYPLAIENKELYFSSTIKDEPIENYKYVNGSLVSGPNNAYGYYKGNMLLTDAIMYSSNATAVQALQLIGGPEVAYEQVVTKMGFNRLTEEDANIMGSLTIGGMNGGVSVRQMAAAYTYLGNGGLYYKPYTYYYVTDSEDNVILDNRSPIPEQAYSAETAGIMNRLLSYNMTNATTSMTNAPYARIAGWDIIGKTGTTDEDKDSWYCGCSPYGVMATWCGFDTPATISSTGKRVSASFFAKVMGKYLEDKEQKDYTLPSTLIEAQFNPSTGLIISTDNVSGKYIGYYTEDNMPSYGSAYYSDNNSSSSNYNSYNNDYNNYDNNNNYYSGDNSSSSSGSESGSGNDSSSSNTDGEGSNNEGENGGETGGGEGSNNGGENGGGEGSNNGGENGGETGGGNAGNGEPNGGDAGGGDSPAEG